MEEAPESTQERTGEDGEIDDGGSESEDSPIDLTLAGAEDSDEQAATEAERDNPSCSSEPPDESAWDTSVGSTSPRGASPRYASPRYASPRYASPQYASPHYASSDFPTSWYQSNPRFATEESPPSTYQPFPRGRCQHPLSTWGGIRVFQRTTETTVHRYRESQESEEEEDEDSEWTASFVREREDYHWATTPGGYRVTQVRQVTMDIIPPLGQGPAFQFEANCGSTRAPPLAAREAWREEFSNENT